MMTYWAGDVKENAASFRPQDKGPQQPHPDLDKELLLAEVPYLTFDDPLNREFATRDPNGFLDQFHGKTAILDEIQYVPGILPYIKIRIDKDRRPGSWVLTGSQRFSLMRGVSETLAGRIAVLELAPFNLRESEGLGRSLEEALWAGLFPEPAWDSGKRDLWISSYIQTYIEGDVRQIESVRDLHAFEMFIHLCAAHHAQEFHPAALSRDAGVTQPTVKNWATLLEACYLAVLLPPFFRNYGKRVIKSPKFYFSDPSLVCALTRQPSPDSLLMGSMGGALFEGLMVTEAWKAFLNAGIRPSMYFWRSQGGLEVDLVIHSRGKFWPVEIKLTSTPSANFTKPLDRFRDMAGKEAAEKGFVVCRVDKPTNLPGNNTALPCQAFSSWLEEVIA